MPAPAEPERALRDAFPSLASRAGAALPHLVADLRAETVEPGALVLAEDAPNARLYFTCSGELTVECRAGSTRLRVGTLGPGSWFGELGFLEAGPSTAEVRAVAPSLVLSLGRDNFARYMDTHPVLADAVLAEILPAMTQRLRGTEELLGGRGGRLNTTPTSPDSWVLRGWRALFGRAQ